jgi:hypothetical protein
MTSQSKYPSLDLPKKRGLETLCGAIGSVRARVMVSGGHGLEYTP